MESFTSVRRKLWPRVMNWPERERMLVKGRRNISEGQVKTSPWHDSIQRKAEIDLCAPRWQFCVTTTLISIATKLREGTTLTIDCPLQSKLQRIIYLWFLPSTGHCLNYTWEQWSPGVMPLCFVRHSVLIMNRDHERRWCLVLGGLQELHSPRTTNYVLQN